MPKEERKQKKDVIATIAIDRDGSKRIKIYPKKDSGKRKPSAR